MRPATQVPRQTMAMALCLPHLVGTQEQHHSICLLGCIHGGRDHARVWRIGNCTGARHVGVPFGDYVAAGITVRAACGGSGKDGHGNITTGCGQAPGRAVGQLQGIPNVAPFTVGYLPATGLGRKQRAMGLDKPVLPMILRSTEHILCEIGSRSDESKFVALCCRGAERKEIVGVLQQDNGLLLGAS